MATARTKILCATLAGKTSVPVLIGQVDGGGSVTLLVGEDPEPVTLAEGDSVEVSCSFDVKMSGREVAG